MLTVREARAIAQNALQLSKRKSDRAAQSGSSPAREAEQLRASVLGGDLPGAKRQARMILEHNEMPDESDPPTLLLRTFAQTLSGMLEGKIGVDVRHTATSSLVRNEQEARQAAEQRAEQMERESAGLRRALVWYAREANYRSAPELHQHESPTSAADQDHGLRARQALGDSQSGWEVARRLEAAEELVEHLKADLGNYEQEISQHDTPG